MFVGKIPSFKGSPCPMGFDPMAAIEHFLYPRAHGFTVRNSTPETAVSVQL